MTRFVRVNRGAPDLLKRSERVAASQSEPKHVGSLWLRWPRREDGSAMAIIITEDFMALEIGGTPAAPATRQPDGRTRQFARQDRRDRSAGAVHRVRGAQPLPGVVPAAETR